MLYSLYIYFYFMHWFGSTFSAYAVCHKNFSRKRSIPFSLFLLYSVLKTIQFNPNGGNYKTTLKLLLQCWPVSSLMMVSPHLTWKYQMQGIELIVSSFLKYFLPLTSRTQHIPDFIFTSRALCSVSLAVPAPLTTF